MKSVICNCIPIQNQVYLNYDHLYQTKIEFQTEIKKKFWSCDIL